MAINQLANNPAIEYAFQVTKLVQFLMSNITADVYKNHPLSSQTYVVHWTKVLECYKQQFNSNKLSAQLE